ncbi:phospholipase D/nuclease [Ceratobasidium sp. AG-I]|nr:phospholipase D/nuclease [Ceratobasidium sp. AG-I]
MSTSGPVESNLVETEASELVLEESHPENSSDGPKKLVVFWASGRRVKVETKNIPASGSLNHATRAGNFWHGAVLPTFNHHADESPDVSEGLRIMPDVIGLKRISIDESHLTLCSDLLFAIVSSFVTDPSWIRSCFPPGIPVILVHEPEDDKTAKVKRLRSGWVLTCPTLGSWGCMHTKLMVLFYKSGRIRVVISSANCVKHEWNVVGNVVWLQDIPPAAEATPEVLVEPEGAGGPGLNPQPEQESFQDGLARVLKALNVPAALDVHLEAHNNGEGIALPIQHIDDIATGWDWSRVKAHLVPSIAGKHTGWSDINKVGHAALASAVNRLGFRGQHLQLEYQGSSLGNYTPEWLEEFVTSARGTLPNQRPYRPQRRQVVEPPSGLKIIWPTEKTAIESENGVDGTNTIIGFRKVYWDRPNFPRRAFHSSVSKQGNVVMHSKMILALSSDSVAEQNPKLPRGWLYVGSHNFSPLAWGKISGGFSPTLELANYELGIVIPIESEEEGDRLACWKRPARPYARGLDKPWTGAGEEEN